MLKTFHHVCGYACMEVCQCMWICVCVCIQPTNTAVYKQLRFHTNSIWVDIWIQCCKLAFWVVAFFILFGRKVFPISKIVYEWMKLFVLIITNTDAHTYRYFFQILIHTDTPTHLPHNCPFWGWFIVKLLNTNSVKYPYLYKYRIGKKEKEMAKTPTTTTTTTKIKTIGH